MFNVLSSKGGVLVYFSDFGHVSVFKILLLKLCLVCWIRIWKRFYKNWSITYLKLSLKSGHFQINMKRLMLDYLWYIQISTLYIVYANKTLSVYTVYTNKPLSVYTVYTNKPLSVYTVYTNKPLFVYTVYTNKLNLFYLLFFKLCDRDFPHKKCFLVNLNHDINSI